MYEKKKLMREWSSKDKKTLEARLGVDRLPKPGKMHGIRLEVLNPEKGTILTMRKIPDGRHMVCLCMADKTEKTVYNSRKDAFARWLQLQELYKSLGMSAL